MIVTADSPPTALLNTILAVAVGGGLFYLLFQVSKGKWIGGGDVKLGGLLGLVAGTPARSLLLIFLASLLGSFISLPLLANHRLKRTSMIPFGPFLIIAAILVQLFGIGVLHWYRQTFINF
jgi:prepilin signal peptidase PulO-like enzyme (type II secretory pathway)